MIYFKIISIANLLTLEFILSELNFGPIHLPNYINHPPYKSSFPLLTFDHGDDILNSLRTMILSHSKRVNKRNRIERLLKTHILEKKNEYLEKNSNNFSKTYRNSGNRIVRKKRQNDRNPTNSLMNFHISELEPDYGAYYGGTLIRVIVKKRETIFEDQNKLADILKILSENRKKKTNKPIEISDTSNKMSDTQYKIADNQSIAHESNISNPNNQNYLLKNQTEHLQIDTSDIIEQSTDSSKENDLSNFEIYGFESKGDLVFGKVLLPVVWFMINNEPVYFANSITLIKSGKNVFKMTFKSPFLTPRSYKTNCTIRIKWIVHTKTYSQNESGNLPNSNNAESLSLGNNQTLDEVQAAEDNLELVLGSNIYGEPNLNLPGDYNITLIDEERSMELSHRFIYRPNPFVNSTVTPGFTIIDGGIRITITGNNLNSSSKPTLLVSVVHKWFAEGPCQTVSSTLMYCWTPTLNLTNEMMDNYGMPMELYYLMRIIVFKFSIKMDERLHSINTLKVYPNPEIDQFSPPLQEFIINQKNRLTITGRWSNIKHFSVDDVTILIGGVSCLDLEMSKKSITCSPPSLDLEQVQKNNEQNSKLEVVIKIGYVTAHVGWLRLVFLSPPLSPVIIVMVIILSMVLIIGILSMIRCPCCTNDQHHKSRQSARNLMSSNRGIGKSNSPGFSQRWCFCCYSGTGGGGYREDDLLSEAAENGTNLVGRKGSILDSGDSSVSYSKFKVVRVSE